MVQRGDSARLALGFSGVALVTAVYAGWLHITNATTVALTFLLVVLVVAAASSLWVAVTTSLAAMLCFNFFFLPPVGTFTIADLHNWIALVVFLSVSLVASNLSSIARARTEDALLRRDETARLFDLSRDVLLMTERAEAIEQLARSIARRFDLEYVAICLPREADWDIAASGSVALDLDRRELSLAIAGADRTVEFDARDRSRSRHHTVMAGSREVQIVPLRFGARPTGVLAAAGRPVDGGLLDALGGIVAIAIERVNFLEERKAAALARQSEELKSALLASLGHDLRTPLTAIRIAATNLQASWLAEPERREQSQLVLAEVGRLTRLFDGILDMARIDAGAVSSELQWVLPSQIVDAAREQAEQSVARHPINVSPAPETLVRLDPRLTASALAHLLDNAGKYGPAGTAIDVDVRIIDAELVLSVRDRGPGIRPADLPRVFDRFYRGGEAKRVSGTGMGLAIARGLLAAERGRLWAENCPGGGARFTIAVPVQQKPLEQSA